PAQNLVPPKIALDVNPLGTFHQRLPDWLARLDPGRLHLVTLGDDARPLVPQHPHRLAAQEPIPHPLRRHVKTVGVQVTNRCGTHSDYHVRKYSMNFWIGQEKRGQEREKFRSASSVRVMSAGSAAVRTIGWPVAG